MKLGRLLTVLLLVSLALAAVGPVNAQAGGKILWSVEGISEITTLDPAKATDSQAFLVINFLYGRLVKLDATLNVIPDLAEKWDISDDGLTYTFKLRDVKFSDGKTITAEDIAFSLQYAFDPQVGGGNASFYLGGIVGVEDFVSGKTPEISGVTIIDARTLSIKIKAATAVFIKQLTFGFWVISKAQVTADKDWARNPVTSGGFLIKSRRPNQGITLAPNPGYWQKAGVEEIDFQFIQESETAYQLYKTGSLDVMGSQQNGVPVAHIAEVQGTPDFKQASTLAIRYIGFNNKAAPFDNQNVRRAFALAIDKKALAERALAGAVTPADRILPPGMPGGDLPVKALEFNADEARKALADSGYTPEKLGTVTITYGIEGDNERVLTFLQAMWKQNLGVDVRLEPMELAKFSESLNTLRKEPATSTMQMYYSFWGADYPDAQNFLSQQLQTTQGNNNGNWSDAEFDKLTEQADLILNDEPARWKLYNQAEQIALDKVGWLPIFYPKTNVLIRAGIEGVVINANGVSVPDYAALKGRTG